MSRGHGNVERFCLATMSKPYPHFGSKEFNEYSAEDLVERHYRSPSGFSASDPHGYANVGYEDWCQWRSFLSSMRRALRNLERQGLVERRDGYGQTWWLLTDAGDRCRKDLGLDPDD